MVIWRAIDARPYHSVSGPCNVSLWPDRRGLVCIPEIFKSEDCANVSLSSAINTRQNERGSEGERISKRRNSNSQGKEIHQRGCFFVFDKNRGSKEII